MTQEQTTPLVTDELLAFLQRRVDKAEFDLERDEYAEALATARRIQAGEYRVYAEDEESGYVESIHTIEQLRVFGRAHPAAWAYYVVAEDSQQHDLGDFGEHGGIAGTLLCAMLPYDGPGDEIEDNGRVIADFASDAEAIEYLRTHSLFEDENG